MILDFLSPLVGEDLAYIAWTLIKIVAIAVPVILLENGETVKCVEVEGRGRVFWELNNPEDVARIEGVIEQ